MLDQEIEVATQSVAPAAVNADNETLDLNNAVSAYRFESSCWGQGGCGLLPGNDR